jgi:hypothetical protein
MQGSSQPEKQENTRMKIRFLIALFCISAMSLTAAAQVQAVEPVGQAELQAQAAWRTTMHEISIPAAGCFHASFPSTRWEAVECAPAPGYRSALPKPFENRIEVAGNGSDWVAQAPSGHLFSLVKGSFPTVTGVTSEKSVGVAAFGGGGILGANEYTLQVNTNFAHTSACGSSTRCIAWVQYILATNTPVSLTSSQLTGNSEVFIEYWLIDFGSSTRAACPSGFVNAGADAAGPGVDCVQNTPATLVARGQIPITQLATLTLSGSATSGGNDVATTTFGTSAFSASVADSRTAIASGWSQAEFNIVGNAGGSRAQFNAGSKLTVKVAVTDGSTTAPGCIPPSQIAGTTGETNNLTLGSCTATGGTAPFIQFTESD